MWINKLEILNFIVRSSSVAVCELLNGIFPFYWIVFLTLKNQLLGKSLRVDHVQDYKPPKDNDDYDDITRKLHSEGCAPVVQIAERNIKREESRRPVKRERSPDHVRRERSPIPTDVSRVKHERSDSRLNDGTVCNLFNLLWFRRISEVSMKV